MLSDKVRDPNKPESGVARALRYVRAFLLYTLTFGVLAAAIGAGYQARHFDDNELTVAAVTVDADDDSRLQVTFRAEGACWVNPFVTRKLAPSFRTVRVRASALSYGDCPEGAEVTRTVALTGPLGDRAIVDGAGATVPGSPPQAPEDVTSEDGSADNAGQTSDEGR